jgi:hypothetical protein
MRDHRKSFQLPMKAKIASVASAGFESGKIILQNIVNSEAPSMRAGSSSGILFDG